MEYTIKFRRNNRESFQELRHYPNVADIEKLRDFLHSFFYLVEVERMEIIIESSKNRSKEKIKNDD